MTIGASSAIMLRRINIERNSMFATENIVEDDTTVKPKPERGWFGVAVKDLINRVNAIEERLARLEANQVSFENTLEKLGALQDPEEIEYLWKNFEDMTEVVSSLRRASGFPPLAEFEGSRQRRRVRERKENNRV